MKTQQLELFTNKFKLTNTGLEVNGKPDFEEWMDYGQSLKTLDSTARQFAIGDWIVHGFDTYEHGKWEAVKQVWGEEIETLRQYEWVSKQIKSVTRVTHLSWTHHREVADLTPDKQRYWLEQAAANKWSVATLRQKIKTASLSVEVGQVWILGAHRLMCGDAYNTKHVAELNGNNAIAALITDPPYGIGYKPDWNKWDGSASDFTEVIGDDVKFNPVPFLNYPTVVLFGASYYSDLLPIGGWICWDKRLDETKDSMLGSPFELAWYRSANTTRKAIMIRVLHGGVVNADSITGNNEKRLHPTQKPIAVMEQIVTALTKSDDLIYDPFSGVGSTLLACERVRRRCYAMEIEPDYVANTLDRWMQLTGQEPILWQG